MGLLKKFGVVMGFGLFAFSSVALGIFNAEAIRIQNIQTGFLSYPHLDTIQPYNIQSTPTKTVDIVDWEALDAIPNGSIEECSKPSTASKSWQFLTEHKRSETDFILVSRYNESYPCRYIAEHLRSNHFGMASLEDIPLAISQKFFSKYPIFFREVSFYKEWLHDPKTSINGLKHEEMHLIQALHNPYLERYMWNDNKTKLTDFGLFIEGCTDFHFKTNGPGYYYYVEDYEKILSDALMNDRKIQIDRACGGDYDAFVQLGSGAHRILNFLCRKDFLYASYFS